MANRHHTKPHHTTGLSAFMIGLGSIVSLASCDGGTRSAQLATSGTTQDLSALSAGTSGVIHPQKDGGKCLDIRMGSQDNGTPVQLATCYPNDVAQVWTFTGSQLKVFGNKCLDVTEGKQQNGVKLQIWDCDSNNGNQQWSQQGQTFVWQNKYCLDLTDGNTNDLNLIQIWECGSGNVNQQWNGAGSTAAAGSSATVASDTSANANNTTNTSNSTGGAADSYSSNTPGPSNSALSQPQNSLSIIDYGAQGDGNGDYTAQIQAAFDAARSQGKIVWIPSGTFAHSGVLTLNGIKVVGAGNNAILKATSATNSAIILSGNGPQLSNVQTQVSANARSSQPKDCAVLISGASSAKVSYVYTRGAGANGVRIDNSSGCTITKCIINGSNADGVALVNRALNNTISYTQSVNCWDDSFSSDCYSFDLGQNSGNVFTNCYAGPNKYGRSFVFMGSANETVKNSVSQGSLWNGISVGAASYTLQNVGGFTVTNNLIIGNASGQPVIVTMDNGSSQSGNAGNMANVSNNATSGDVSQVLGWSPVVGLPSPESFNSYRGGGDGSNNG